jgi:membrane associated rhomboid family serine protease
MRGVAWLISATTHPEIFFVARSSEPIFNVPPVVLGLSIAMALVHGVRALLDKTYDNAVLLYFAFIPARYEASELGVQFPGGLAADVWTFVTHAFLHADVMHIIANLVWFLAFGSAVAWRFGTLRFLVFFAVTATAGAGAFLLTHWAEFVPLVGASGAISGMMAAACRFVFAEGGPLGFFGRNSQEAYKIPAVSLRVALRNRQVVTFLAIWFLFNLIFGIGSISSSLTEATVAWETHIGGFLAGLLLFRFFDPVGRTMPGVPLAPTGEEEDH